MSDFTPSPRFFQLLTASLQPLIPKVSAHFASDWGCHKFTTAQPLDLTLLAHLEQVASSTALIEDEDEELNELSGQGHERNLREMIGFDFYEYGEAVTFNQSSRVPAGCGLMPSFRGLALPLPRLVGSSPKAGSFSPT